MNKTEKIGIIILIILILIFLISLFAGAGTKKTSAKDQGGACGVLCRENEDKSWSFTGKTFDSKEDCLSQCKEEIRKR